MPKSEFSKPTVIFDMDGVLVEHTRYHTKSWQIALKKFGQPFTIKQIQERFHGRTNTVILKELLGPKSSEAVNSQQKMRAETSRLKI